MTNNKKFSLMLFGYVAIRIFSYLFPPATPLHAAHPVNTIAAIVILFITAYALIKGDERGWYIVAAELILGGTGSFFYLGSLTLRTYLLLASLSIFIIQKMLNHTFKQFISANKKILYLFGALLLIVGTALVRGLLAGHNFALAISGVVPYLFLFYYFPLTELIASQKFRAFAQAAVLAAVVGNCLFIVFSFIGYSSGWFIIQDSYYHWFRDVANGKIRELPFHYYRILLNEQLLLIPLLLYYVAGLYTVNKSKIFSRPTFLVLLPIALLLIIFSFNLTRIYLIALVVTLGVFFTKQYWRQWIVASASILILFITLFTALHLAASRGASLGWELFGLRLQSIVSPELEESSLSRLLLLPKIVDKIKMSPLFGHGLGDTVTVFSPILKQTITTAQFDWGYLQIIDELGLVGLTGWLVIITYTFIRLKMRRGGRWPVASLIALLIINLTSPALFHVFSAVWIAFLLAYANNVS